MRRLGLIAVAAASLLAPGVMTSACDTAAPPPPSALEPPSLTDQLVGAWTLVSVHDVQGDGRRLDASGPDPQGTVIYTRDGRFAFILTRSDLPRLASNSRDRGTPEENRAVVAGSIAYFGTYSVNEADRVIALDVEGSTFANLVGRDDHRRLIVSLTADEMTFRNPATLAGGTLELTWTRAR